MFHFSPRQGFGILAVVSIVFLLISYEFEKKHPVEQGVEPNGCILVLRWTHYFCILFTCLYCVLFDQTLDVLFLVFVFGMYTHWPIFRGECILNYLETKYYYPDYILGEENGKNIYMRLVFGNVTNVLLIVFGVLSAVNTIIVLQRQKYLLKSTFLYTMIILYMLAIGLYKLQKM